MRPTITPPSPTAKHQLCCNDCGLTFTARSAVAARDGFRDHLARVHVAPAIVEELRRAS